MNWLPWVALIGGGGLVLFGLVKILVSGVRILAWMFLLGLGLVAAAYGLRQHPAMLDQLGIPAHVAVPVRNFLAPGGR